MDLFFDNLKSVHFSYKKHIIHFLKAYKMTYLKNTFLTKVS